jgi:hypothetical protein
MARQRLYNRNDARKVLGNISVDTLRRLEKAGKLTPVKLYNSKAQTFYRVEQVEALATPRPKIKRRMLAAS